MKIGSLRQYCLYLAKRCLWLVPVPFGAFASDRGIFPLLSFWLFVIASLFWPVWLRRRELKRTGHSDEAPPAMQLYGAVTGLLIMIGIMTYCQEKSLWQNYYGRTGIYFFWMIAVVAVQTLLARGFSFWQKRRRLYWFSEFLDPVLYALPLPCAFMGMCFFPSIETAYSGAGIGLVLLMGLCVYMTVGFVLAVFALYFYPRKEYYPHRSDRLVQLVRVLVMSVVWLGLNVPNSPYMQFVSAHTPWLQNNPLVFVVPFASGTLTIVAAVAFSNIVPIVWSHFCSKR